MEMIVAKDMQYCNLTSGLLFELFLPANQTDELRKSVGELRTTISVSQLPTPTAQSPSTGRSWTSAVNSSTVIDCHAIQYSADGVLPITIGPCHIHGM